MFPQLLSEEDIKMMREATRDAVPVATNSSKMFEPAYKLKTGRPVAATKGLEDRMCVHANRVQYYERIGKGVEGIQEEVDEFHPVSKDPDPEEIKNVQEVKDLLRYVRFESSSEKTYSNGIRDHGRTAVKLEYFLDDSKAKEGGLSEAELVALRMYTTIAFLFMNRPLRDDGRYEQGEPCPLPVLTYFAWTGIKKLRALYVGSGTKSLWRGMRNLDVADEFMKEGGTEMAFMSTTTDLSVAVRYCLSNQSLIFKVVSTDFMSMGADVQWLSAFPGEAEILYPPLTYLKPSGRTQVAAVIYAAPSCIS
jgi:hypothetical protein